MGKSAINPAVVGKHSTDIAALKNDLGIVEDGDTATHTIAQGQYVIWQGALYTADAAIASGTTLAASGGNKNLTAVENGGLNALNSKIGIVPSGQTVEGQISSLNSKLYSSDLASPRFYRLNWGTTLSITLPTGHWAIFTFPGSTSEITIFVLWHSGSGLNTSNLPSNCTATLSGDTVTVTTSNNTSWGVIVM